MDNTLWCIVFLHLIWYIMVKRFNYTGGDMLNTELVTYKEKCTNEHARSNQYDSHYFWSNVWNWLFKHYI